MANTLSRMMDLADQKVKEGSLLDAAEIARYVMVLTCAEYEADHPYGENYTEMWVLRRKPLRAVMERAKVMLTDLLITGDDIDWIMGKKGVDAKALLRNRVQNYKKNIETNEFLMLNIRFFDKKS